MLLIFFKLFCGLRQGCPLSPLLYIISSEILNLAIRNDNSVKGIMVENTEIIISAYADDTTIYLKDFGSLHRVVHILETFQIYSGLKINLDKSELLPLGLFKDNHPDLNNDDLHFTANPVRLLGVVFSSDLSNIFELNFVPKLKKLKEILRIWSMRDLSPIGKITIVKSLGLSQLIFLFSVLPKPPDNFLKEIDSIIFKFIWSGKPDKLSRKSIIGDYEKGGLKMVHIPSVINGLKVAWVKRLLDVNNNGKWKCFYMFYMKQIGGNLFWECNTKPEEKCIKLIKNVFIGEILNAWCTITYDSPSSHFRHQILWNNSSIVIAQNTVYKKVWHEKGVKFISDILNEDDSFLPLDILKTKYNLQCNFLEYFALIYAIPNVWIRSVERGEDLGTVQNDHDDMLALICSSKKVCKLVHKICVDKLFKTPKAEAKWAVFFDDMNLNWNDIYRIPLSSSLSTKLRYFQFKILHRIIGINENLFKYGYVDSNLCTFCNQELENIPHLFWQCGTSAQFWKKVQDNIFKKKVTLTMKDVLMGILDVDYCHYNFVVLQGKKFIYNARCNKNKLDIQGFKGMLNNVAETEKHIANNKGKMYEWNKRWNSINM